MRVLINAQCTQGERTGVGYHTSELVRCLRQRAGEVRVGCYPPWWCRLARSTWVPQAERWEHSSRQPGPWSWLQTKVRGRVLGVTQRIARMLVGDPFDHMARRGGYDLYHEPNFIPFDCDLPTVITVHDLSVLLHPEWHPARRIAHYESGFRRGLERCRHLFTVSEFSKREVVEVLGWPRDRVSVTPNGVRPGLRRMQGAALTAGLRQLGLQEGYLLHVGTLEPRKNLLLLMRAYCALPPAVRERHPLVLAGGMGWNSANVHEYLWRHGKHKGVRWLGYVAEGLFPALYSGARGLVFPSLYEGFGLPPVEMLACGGAVVASTAEAVAEVTGGQAHLVDPLDEGGWRDAMLRLCLDDDWRQTLGAGAEDAASRFTWQRCAGEALAGYRRALGIEASSSAARPTAARARPGSGSEPATAQRPGSPAQTTRQSASPGRLDRATVP
jgi:alpha-1,3-rhamnosyl/mannosyltransferase